MTIYNGWKNYKKIFKKDFLMKILIFITYSLILTFAIEWFARGNINDAYEFLRHFFKTFLYNVLIVSLTLSPCFLFKRRVFAFSVISLIWIILGIANSFLINFRETPLTFADLGMIKSGLELSNQYLTKNYIILISISLLLIILTLILLFFKSKKIKVKYFRNISLLSSDVLGI